MTVKRRVDESLSLQAGETEQFTFDSREGRIALVTVNATAGAANHQLTIESQEEDYGAFSEVNGSPVDQDTDSEYTFTFTELEKNTRFTVDNQESSGGDIDIEVELHDGDSAFRVNNEHPNLVSEAFDVEVSRDLVTASGRRVPSDDVGTGGQVEDLNIVEKVESNQGPVVIRGDRYNFGTESGIYSYFYAFSNRLTQYGVSGASGTPPSEVTDTISATATNQRALGVQVQGEIALNAVTAATTIEANFNLDVSPNFFDGYANLPTIYSTTVSPASGASSTQSFTTYIYPGLGINFYHPGYSNSYTQNAIVPDLTNIGVTIDLQTPGGSAPQASAANWAAYAVGYAIETFGVGSALRDNLSV